MDIKQVFFDNLLMLDFDAQGLSAKHYVTLNKDMFVMPNHRAFQYVTHFLFQRLDKVAADEAFRHCWPIGDKRAEAEFRKVTTNWLSELASHSDGLLDMPFPRIVPSLFMSPGGDRFYYLMLCFSRLVLVRVYVRDYGINPYSLTKPPAFTILPKDSPIRYHTFTLLSQAMVVAERSQFVQELEQLHNEQVKWAEAANRFVAGYRSALRFDKGDEENLRIELEAAADEGARLAGLGQWSRRFRSPSVQLNTGTPGCTATTGKMAQRAVAERVRKYWRRIETMWTSGQAIIQIITDCLNDRSGPNGELAWRLDGSSIPIRLPDILVHRLEEMALTMVPSDDDELDEDNENAVISVSKIVPADLYQQNKLNLVAVIRFATLALNLYCEQLNAIVGSADFTAVSESLTSQLPNDCRHLKQKNTQLRETKKACFQLHSSLQKRVLNKLDETVYRLPATISSLSCDEGNNNVGGMSPSLFTASAVNHDNKLAVGSERDVIETPVGLQQQLGKKKADIDDDLLDLSGGPNDLDLVPMTPLSLPATINNNKSRKQLVAQMDPHDENDNGEDLLIDLRDFTR